MNVWNQIASYISSHRREIDLDVPRPDLWMDIEEGLQASGKTHWFSRWPYLKVAAVVLITLGLSYVSFGPGFDHPQHQEQTETSSEPEYAPLADATPNIEEEDTEFQELETYYLMKLARQQQSLEPLMKEKQELARAYLDELEQIDQTYEELKRELSQEGPYEYRVKLLIQTYELKLRILKQLQQQILKAKEHEKPKQS